MVRTWKRAAIAVLVATAVLSAAPTTATAQEVDTRRPTTLVGGSYVLGFEALYVPLDVFTVSAALFEGDPISQLRLPGRLVVFSSGNQVLCAALTAFDLTLPSGNHGVARCSYNPLSPGGLNALLTGSVVAHFPGDTTHQAATVNLPAIGKPAPRHLIF
jgi:hypothetical protein